MSGRTKRTAYRIFLLACGLGALVGTVLLALNGLEPAKENAAFIWAFSFAIISLVLLPVNTLVHECGHLTFGWMAGMRFSSVRFGRLRLVRVGKKLRLRRLTEKDVAGSCEMYPRNEKNVRGRMIFYSLGGAIFNLIYGGVWVATYFLFEMHPALYFFQLFAPLSLLEAAASLFPVETATGNTDGEMVRTLAKRTSNAMLSLHVLTAQGMLSYSEFSDIDRAFLFDLPVVREDEPAFLAITQLRWQYLFYLGEEEGALRQLDRLEELYAYLPEINRGEVACDLLYARACLQKDERGAEGYLVDAALAKGSCAYFRAMAAFSTLRKEEVADEYYARAKQMLQEEGMKGVACLEDRFLSRISIQEQSE